MYFLFRFNRVNILWSFDLWLFFFFQFVEFLGVVLSCISLIHCIDRIFQFELKILGYKKLGLTIDSHLGRSICHLWIDFHIFFLAAQCLYQEHAEHGIIVLAVNLSRTLPFLIPWNVVEFTINIELFISSVRGQYTSFWACVFDGVNINPPILRVAYHLLDIFVRKQQKDFLF